MKSNSAGLALAFSLVLTGPALAQDAPVSRAGLERDVRTLSADNMEGRETGTRGHERAAGYVAGRFAGMGLEPQGDDGTWFQSVPLQVTTPVPDAAALTLIGPEGEQVLTPWTDFYVTGTAQQESGTIEVPLVFIGYGLDMPGRDDFAGVDLTGKIAVRIYGGPEIADTEERAHIRSTLSKRVSDHGAVGLLLLWTPVTAAAYKFEDSAKSAREDTGMTWVQGDGRPHSQAPRLLVTGALSEDQSRALLAGLDFDYDDVVAAEQTADMRMPSFAMGRSARISFASTFSHLDSPNVVGILPGSDPALADQYVVLTAHLDHLGIEHTDEEGDDEIYNGAMDNAVGVASLMEVARLLAQGPPRRPVLFIALTGEEEGLIGSSFNAANPTVPRGQVVANVNMDMPMVTYDFSDVVAFGAERSNLFPQVESAAQQYGLMLSPDPQPEQGFFTRSDQYSYVSNGVPAVYLDLGWGNGGEAAQDDFLEHHYHEVSDEADLIDFAAMTRIAGVNFTIARNIANMDDRPAWNAGDFFGELAAAAVQSGGE